MSEQFKPTSIETPNQEEEQTSAVNKLESFKPEDKELIDEIKSLIENIKQSENIPEEIRDMLSELDADEKKKEIQDSLEAKEREYETIEQDLENDKVRIGRETTHIFEGSGEELKWDIEAEQFREQGQTMVEIKFRRSDGIEVSPGLETKDKIRLDDRDRFIPLNEYKAVKKERSKYNEAVKDLKSENEEKRTTAEKYLKTFREKHSESEWVLRTLRHLNGLAVSETDDALELDPHFVETPHVVETLEKFTSLANFQLETQQGILIMEGEAGTGKNKMVDHFAHLTRRPVFRFTCSAGTDTQDLKYLLEFDQKRGTYRIKSSVLEAIQTPGAILELDEINTLKPGTAKSLNSLFDHDRSIFLGEDKNVVRAANDVLLVGLQNPQHYMGVDKLAETIKSRARIMGAEYPPFIAEKKNPDEKIKYRSDEALMIRRYVPELAELSDQEFVLLWNSVINKEKDAQATDFITQKREEKINELKEIVEIANKIRTAHKEYLEGKMEEVSDTTLDFSFSIRESIQSAAWLKKEKVSAEEKKRGITRAKKSVLDVILRKIDDLQERAHIQKMIEEI